MLDRTLKELREVINHPSGELCINSLVAQRFLDDDDNFYYLLRFSIMLLSEEKIIETGYLKSTNAEHVRKFKSLDALYEVIEQITGNDYKSNIYFVEPSIPQTEEDHRQLGLI